MPRVILRREKMLSKGWWTSCKDSTSSLQELLHTVLFFCLLFFRLEQACSPSHPALPPSSTIKPNDVKQTCCRVEGWVGWLFKVYGMSGLSPVKTQVTVICLRKIRFSIIKSPKRIICTTDWRKKAQRQTLKKHQEHRRVSVSSHCHRRQYFTFCRSVFFSTICR